MYVNISRYGGIGLPSNVDMDLGQGDDTFMWIRVLVKNVLPTKCISLSSFNTCGGVYHTPPKALRVIPMNTGEVAVGRCRPVVCPLTWIFQNIIYICDEYTSNVIYCCR